MHTPTRRGPRPQLLTVFAAAAFAACADDPATTLLGPEPAGPVANELDVQQQQAPINDDFDDAVVVTDLPFSDTIDTSDATTAPDDPDCAGQGPTVWYVFTPAEDATIEANTFGSDYDTTLSAYTGTRGDLVQIACNDDDFGLQSRIVIEVTAGEPVYFMVGAFDSGPGGSLVFNVDIAPPPPPPLEASVEIDRSGSFDPKTGIATIRGTFTCSRPSFVDVFGILRDRIGRIRVEAFFGDFFFCDGSGSWEVQVVAENAFLVGGPVEVNVSAFFFDPDTGAFTFDEATATVRLRGSPRGGPSIVAGGRPTVQLLQSPPRPFRERMAKARGAMLRP